MEELHQIVIELENRIPHLIRENTSVTKASVGWHVEHTLLTINVIIEELKLSNPKEYTSKFSLPKLAVFALNYIPRGKAKAPSVVQPAADFNMDSLKIQIKSTIANVGLLPTFNANQYFKHPIFGMLNLKPTIKFLTIHSQHHLKIIDDILKRS